MAATPPGAKKQKIDFVVDKNIYDLFMKMCSNKGFAPQIVVEKAMKRFAETGQVN